MTCSSKYYFHKILGANSNNNTRVGVGGKVIIQTLTKKKWERVLIHA